MKTLTKAQVFQHMTDNVRAGNIPVYGLEFYTEAKQWETLERYVEIQVLFEVDYDFRITPRTHTLNGYDVPAPETDTPEYEAEYWILNALGDDGVLEYLWVSGSDDKNALRNGLWLSKEDAIANAKALLGENPYE